MFSVQEQTINRRNKSSAKCDLIEIPDNSVLRYFAVTLN